MLETRKLRVFLCHALQDKPAVRDLYSRLQSEPWINPWLDEEKLLPGQNWDNEIKKAIRTADVIIVCLSNKSVSKEGYIQREFKTAYDLALEKPDDTIFVIPLKLDDCETPARFSQWQWLGYFQPNAQEKLLNSLRLRASSLEILLPAERMPDPAESFSVSSTPMFVAPNSTKATPSGHPLYEFGGLEFVKVPGGDFIMGSENLKNSSVVCSPRHNVTLNYDFYLARFPVTYEQYKLMAKSIKLPILIPEAGLDQHPVVNINWDNAQICIKWLNKNYQVELPKGYRFCLPSEAEWEKAARGEKGNEYPWGDKFDKTKCNTKRSGKGKTTIVGHYSPDGDSPYGCADMAGNVWEWTRSLLRKEITFFKYPYVPDDGREVEDAYNYSQRILRGGSFNDSEQRACCAYRQAERPGFTSKDIGFRVAVSVSHKRS
ncbi:MAG: SUMF1/EgtB/PvdO family nonheme iron enzyme [Anaerolineales bacterium]|nr:SUMF1/EgtB/PvdO family nonheme iron enzyme [Anaerolineales bacterium]